MSNVKEIINTWDPIDLFPFCPEDEYHSEISKIEAFLSETRVEKDLGEYIFALFIKSFGANVFQRSMTECYSIAHKILENGVFNK